MKTCQRLLLLFVVMILSAGCGKFRMKQAGDPKDQFWPQLYRSAARNGVIPTSCSLPPRLLWQKRASTIPAPTIIGLGDFILFGAYDGTLEGFWLSKGDGIGKIAITSKVPVTCAYTPPFLVVLRQTGKNNLICYELDRADTRWTQSVGTTLSEVLVAGEFIYVSALNGRLVQVRLSDGRIVAETSEGGQFYASPALLDGVLVIGDDQGILHAFDANLKPVWQYAAGGAFRAATVLAQRRVYAGSTDGNFYCLDLPTGRLIWKKKIGGNIYHGAVVSDSSVVFGATDHNVYCLDAGTGAEEWRFATGAVVSTAPISTGQTIFIGSMDKNIYALDLKTGEKKWSFAAKGRIRSNPIINNRCLVFAAENDDVYCFALD